MNMSVASVLSIPDLVTPAAHGEGDDGEAHLPGPEVDATQQELPRRPGRDSMSVLADAVHHIEPRLVNRCDESLVDMVRVATDPLRACQADRPARDHLRLLRAEWPRHACAARQQSTSNPLRSTLTFILELRPSM